MTHSFLPNGSVPRLVSGAAEEAGMKGWRGRAAEMVASINPLVLRHRIIV